MQPAIELITSTDHHSQPTTDDLSENQEKESDLTNEQKRKILMILFKRLLFTNRRISQLLAVLHIFLIGISFFQIFTIGTVDSESRSCYLTWPLSHLFYALMNYFFAWFYCYNVCISLGPRSSVILRAYKKFTRFLYICSIFPIILKKLADCYCRNWSLPWRTVVFQSSHVFIEALLITAYFYWFEKKYAGFKLIYNQLRKL